MKVAVIGGAGKMGCWFAKYFIGRGNEVTIYDMRLNEAEAVARKIGARSAKSSFEASLNADLSLVSTPMETMPEILKDIGPNLRETSTIIEISSLKSQIIPMLEEISKKNVKTLSIHPLFGPGTETLTREKIAVVPVADPTTEVRTTLELFPQAEIIVVDSDEHDRAMAFTLSLPHFVNIIFSSVISEEDLNTLKKLAGTTFTLQSIISEGVMNDDASLCASIQVNNKYTHQCLDKFISNCRTLKKHVEEKDSEKFINFYRNVQSSLSRDPDFSKAYRKMYRVLQNL